MVDDPENGALRAQVRAETEVRAQTVVQAETEVQPESQDQAPPSMPGEERWSSSQGQPTPSTSEEEPNQSLQPQSGEELPSIDHLRQLCKSTKSYKVEKRVHKLLKLQASIRKKNDTAKWMRDKSKFLRENGILPPSSPTQGNPKK